MIYKLLIYFIIILNISIYPEYFHNGESGISINLPDGWKTKVKNSFLESVSSDNKVIFRMTSTSANTLPKKLSFAMGSVKQFMDNIEYTTSPSGTTRTLNNMQVTYVEGKGLQKGSKKIYYWSVAVATNKATVAISIFATEEGNTKHAESIGRIINSLTREN